ncbi:MAG: helix-turn-helix domain-containing protein, partial [Oscillibacter sp.]|nr:helix-turn-helix domain-containing protein [Oscillibacter sp.]
LYFAVVAVSGVVTDASSQSEGANCNSESRMEAMLAGCLDGARVSAYLHYMDDSHYNILLNAASEADVPAAARDLAAHAEQFFRECGLRSALTFGVGSAVSSVSDIYRSAEQASSALNIASGATEERVIFYEELAQRITVGYEYPISAETLLLRAITENNAAAAKSILGDVVANNRARQALSYNSLRLLYFSLCSTVVRSAQSIGIPIEVAPEEQYAERGITLTAIRTRIEALIDKVCAEIARKRSEQGNGSEEQIFDYINQNLYDPDISLTKVADRFHKSPAYISMVFKEKFGTNYSDYVNQNRIVRATELLSQGEMSIEEVCFAAGYVSLSTFRRNFTRYTKGNPGDYLPNKRENKPAKKEE